MSHRPHPLQHRAADSLARKSEKKSVSSFSHSKMVLPAVRALPFSQNVFAHFSQCCQRVFFAFFTICSLIFFALFFALFFSLMFRTSLLHFFLTHLFRAMWCPHFFHSLQRQHCVTVPETGHTTTCRSSPSLLTQYSHEQVV